jgi:copper oxidase (laccase) domain-containing protein
VAEYLQDKYQSKATDLLVYCGPAIKAESYIFKDEPKQASDPAWQSYLHKTDGGTGIDLLGFIVARLQAAGVPVQNIETSPVDTATSDNYFSHYRATRNHNKDDDGRFATICMLR